MKKLPAVALAGALWIAGAVPAMAHVTLNPREATKGGYAKFDVRVPNERDDSGTVKVDLQLPEDQPIASVSVQPVPGWTYSVTRRDLETPLVDDEGHRTENVVSLITWTADAGNSIKPGEFMEFPVSIGPLPDDADSLTFKANQTYASGEVVRWIEIAGAGQPAPEHPAPKVALKEAQSTGGAASAPGAPAASTSDTGSSSSNGRSTLALVVAIIAAALALAALTVTRRSSAGAASASRQPT